MQNQLSIGEDLISETRQLQFCNKIHSLQQSQKLGEWDSSLIHAPSMAHDNDIVDLSDSIQSKRKTSRTISQSQQQRVIESTFRDLTEQITQQPTKNGQDGGDNSFWELKQTYEDVNKQQPNYKENEFMSDKEVQLKFFERKNTLNEQKFLRSSRVIKQGKSRNGGSVIDSKDQGHTQSFYKLNKSRIQTQGNIWKYKWMQIIYYVWKFKQMVIQSQMFFRPHLLSQRQSQLIGDKGSGLYQDPSSNQSSFNNEIGDYYFVHNLNDYISFRNYRKIVKFVQKYFGWLFQTVIKIKIYYYSILQKVLQHFPLFHYLSAPYIVWEFIIYLFSSILFLYLPFEYSFKIERSFLLQLYIEIICPIVFCFDILIRANTKTIENGTFIENHVQIFHNYLKSGMMLDILSILSLNAQVFGKGTYFFFFIRINKSFRVIDLFREKFLLKMKMSDNKTLEYIQNLPYHFIYFSKIFCLIKDFQNCKREQLKFIFQTIQIQLGIISLLLLFAQVLFFAHLVSCIWYSVGLSEAEQNKIGWVIKYDVLEEQIYVRYLRCFYYSVITMTTIGYGDITPQSDIEKLVVIFIAFTSCGVFGYSINSIGNILQDFKQKNDLHLQQVAKINQYFKQNKVDLDLQARARQYLDYIYSDKIEDKACSIDNLSFLSEYLQNEIKVSVFAKRMKNIKLFREIFSDYTLEQIALIVIEKIYSPKQKVIDRENIQEPMLYFVQSGAVQKIAQNDINKSFKPIKTIYEGQFFGLDQFIQGDQQPDFNYRSVGVSSLLQIPFEPFMKIIKKNEEQYEKFIYVRDQLMLNQNYQYAHLNCYSCHQKIHTLYTCPYLFYQGKKQRILKFHFQKINETIHNFKRQYSRRGFKTLVNQKYISEQAELYLLNNSQQSICDMSIDNDLDGSQIETENNDKLYPQRLKETTSFRLIQFDNTDENDQAIQKKTEKQISKFGMNSPRSPKKQNLQNEIVQQQQQQHQQQQYYQQQYQEDSFSQNVSQNNASFIFTAERSLRKIPYGELPNRVSFDLEQNENQQRKKREMMTLEKAYSSQISKNSKDLSQINKTSDQYSDLRFSNQQNRINNQDKGILMKPSSSNPQVQLLVDSILQELLKKNNPDFTEKTLQIQKSNLSKLSKGQAVIYDPKPQLFAIGFDVAKIYQFYFPLHNYDIVVERIQQQHYSNLFISGNIISFRKLNKQPKRFN